MYFSIVVDGVLIVCCFVYREHPRVRLQPVDRLDFCVPFLGVGSGRQVLMEESWPDVTLLRSARFGVIPTSSRCRYKNYGLISFYPLWGQQPGELSLQTMFMYEYGQCYLFAQSLFGYDAQHRLGWLMPSLPLFSASTSRAKTFYLSSKVLAPSSSLYGARGRR